MFLERVPRPAERALAHPLGRGVAALRAEELNFFFCLDFIQFYAILWA